MDTKITEQAQNKKIYQLKPKTHPLLLQRMRQKELGAESRTWLELFMACVACLLEELPHINQLLTDLL